MNEFLQHLFSDDYMPHGHCYWWRPEIVWLHAISDSIIALAYFSIPIGLVTFVRRRRDLAFWWMFVMFGIFILGCGMTHVYGIYTIWYPAYGAEGIVKAITAFASIATAGMLWPLIPRAVALPSPAQLQTANDALREQVHERERAEAQLRQLTEALEERVRERTNALHDVIQQAAYGILVLGVDGEVRLANPAALQLLRTSAEALIGRPFPLALRQGRTSDIRLGDGPDAAYADSTISPFVWEGAPALLVSLADVTDRRQAQELRERLVHADRLSAIGQLAAGVAHEINNPTAVVSGNLEVLRSRATALTSHIAEFRADDAMRSLADICRRIEDSMDAVHRVQQIVSGLRTFSRIERDRVESVQLNDIVEIATNLTSNETRHRATVTRELAEDLPQFDGDPSKLAQVATNLLVNAAHAVDGLPGRQEIRVGTRLDGAHLVLTVEDTGRGMSHEVQERVFEPFFTTKPREIGTGLGLSMSAEIVRQHGGEIRVTSAPGQGARFEVWLPVETGLDREPRMTLPEAPAAIRPLRLLVVDDEQLLLPVYEAMLSPPHTVVTASGGAQALAILREDVAFDAILCDLMMPEVDGPAVYAHIAEQHPSLLPRLGFTTGGTFTARAERFVSEHRLVVVDKPFTEDDLQRAVAALARHKSAAP